MVMMMSNNVWKKFDAARKFDQEYSEIRIDPKHPLDLFLAHTPEGESLVLKGLSSPVVNDSKLSGISLLTKPNGEVSHSLYFTLVDDKNQPMFRAIVEDLVKATEDVEHKNCSAGALRISNRVERWRQIFDRMRDNLLSRPEIIGLFGELYYLLEVMLPEFGAATAVNAWRGPFADEQDFAIRSSIVEVKTSLSTRDGSIAISSLNQLDISSGAIFIALIRVATSMPESGGQSLNDIVACVRKFAAVDASASSLLEVCLYAAGYIDDPKYSEEAFAVASLVHLDVKDDFPRLTPASVPEGILSLKYRIDSASCEPFICEKDYVIEALRHV